MQAFLPLKRSAASSTDKYADISEVQYAESKITRVTNIYIYTFAVDNMEESRLPNALVSFSLSALTIFSYHFSADKCLALKKEKTFNMYWWVMFFCA